jgi:hypothetical protein
VDRDRLSGTTAAWSAVVVRAPGGAGAVAWAKAEQRSFENGADVAWGALGDRRVAQAALPAARHPLARRAVELLDALELRDRSGLRLRYNEPWGQGQRRLDGVGRRGAPRGGRRGGGEGLRGRGGVRARGLRRGLGITAKHETSEENVAMVEPLQALGAAIAEYGLQLGAQSRGADEGTRGRGWRSRRGCGRSTNTGCGTQEKAGQRERKRAGSWCHR